MDPKRDLDMAESPFRQPLLQIIQQMYALFQLHRILLLVDTTQLLVIMVTLTIIIIKHISTLNDSHLKICKMKLHISQVTLVSLSAYPDTTPMNRLHKIIR